MRDTDKYGSDAFLHGKAATDGAAAVTLERDPGGVTIRIAGELDLSAVPQLADVLAQLDGEKPGRLLFDLDDVEFMDSSGLGAVVRAQQVAERRGYRLTVRYRESSQVHRLLELTALADHLSRE